MAVNQSNYPMFGGFKGWTLWLQLGPEKQKAINLQRSALLGKHNNKKRGVIRKFEDENTSAYQLKHEFPNELQCATNKLLNELWETWASFLQLHQITPADYTKGVFQYEILPTIQREYDSAALWARKFIIRKGIGNKDGQSLCEYLGQLKEDTINEWADRIRIAANIPAINYLEKQTASTSLQNLPPKNSRSRYQRQFQIKGLKWADIEMIVSERAITIKARNEEKRYTLEDFGFINKRTKHHTLLFAILLVMANNDGKLNLGEYTGDPKITKNTPKKISDLRRKLSQIIKAEGKIFIFSEGTSIGSTEARRTRGVYSLYGTYLAEFKLRCPVLLEKIDNNY